MKRKIFQIVVILLTSFMINIPVQAGWELLRVKIYSCIIFPPFIILDRIIIRVAPGNAPARAAINIPKDWDIVLEESGYFRVGNRVNGEKKFFTYAPELSEELELLSPIDGFKWFAFEDTEGFLDSKPFGSEVVMLWKLKPTPDIPSDFTVGIAAGGGENEGWLSIDPELPATCPAPSHLPVELSDLTASIIENNVLVKWDTGVEISNAGFRLWRATKDQDGGYKSTLLRESGHSERVNPEPNENCSIKIQGQLEIDNSSQPPKLISAIGNSAESTCYSFTDTSNLSDGTYYYLLEDIGDDGKSTFHCDHIDAVTVGQGPAIDLESAINYCKEVTGSNN